MGKLKKIFGEVKTKTLFSGKSELKKHHLDFILLFPYITVKIDILYQFGPLTLIL